MVELLQQDLILLIDSQLFLLLFPVSTSFDLFDLWQFQTASRNLMDPPQAILILNISGK